MFALILKEILIQKPFFYKTTKALLYVCNAEVTRFINNLAGDLNLKQSTNEPFPASQLF